jgi:hypothetical protein
VQASSARLGEAGKEVLRPRNRRAGGRGPTPDPSGGSGTRAGSRSGKRDEERATQTTRRRPQAASAKRRRDPSATGGGADTESATARRGKRHGPHRIRALPAQPPHAKVKAPCPATLPTDRSKPPRNPLPLPVVVPDSGRHGTPQTVAAPSSSRGLWRASAP